MKRYLTLLAITIVAMCFAVGSGFAQSTTAVGTVTASALNVRTSPFANAQLITTVSKGYTAGVVGKNNTSTWYQIILPGGFGWVNGSYISVTNAHTVPVTFTETGTTPPVVAGGYVNTGALNIRPFPSPTGNTPITHVLRNTTLTIWGRNADSSWYKVTTSSNVQGWVRGRYVTVTSGNIGSLPVITETTPTPTPVPPPNQTYAQGYVNTGALNVRSVPSATNNVPLRYILRNTTVNVVGRTGDSEWYQVSAQGIVGWVRGRYITVSSGNVGNAPVTW